MQDNRVVLGIGRIPILEKGGKLWQYFPYRYFGKGWESVAVGRRRLKDSDSVKCVGSVFFIWVVTWIAIVGGSAVRAEPEDGLGSPMAVPHANSAPPGIAWRALAEGQYDSRFRIQSNAEAPMEYSVGSPSPGEQLFLELINRARADPVGEVGRLGDPDHDLIANAVNFFDVDLTLFATEMATLSPAPPLAMNPALNRAAQLHSEDMFQEAFQGHLGTDGRRADERARDAGYDWLRLGENVFSFARSVLHGHAAFEIDWGVGVGGMQDPPRHRLNIHQATYREIGIGVVEGRNGDVGPLVVTQLFGTASDSPILSGVVHYDFDGDGFYDMGEGIGGVRVEVPDASSYAVTADSGGYAIPLPGNGDYEVRFQVPGLPEEVETVTATAMENVKVDLRPAYTVPELTGPQRIPVGCASDFSIPAVGGATAYEWERAGLAPMEEVESLEDDIDAFEVRVTPPYAVRQSEAAALGEWALQLAHPSSDQPEEQLQIQTVVWNPEFRPREGAALRFQSRLGWATTDQEARVEVRRESDQDWVAVWEQAGSDGAGEDTFSEQVVSLEEFVEEEIRVRFVYQASGPGFIGTEEGMGWYIDALALEKTERIVSTERVVLAEERTFAFSPEESGAYLLRARARLPGHWLPWAPGMRVVADSTAPSRIESIERVGSGRLEIIVQAGGCGSESPILQSGPSPSGPWSAEGSAVRHGGPREYRFEMQASGTKAFYRVISR